MQASQLSPIRIRLATNDDADHILAVYAPYISTPITFEESIPAADAFQARVADIRSGYPYIVAEISDPSRPTEQPHIVGYAYAHAQAQRAAYSWNAELSVYLAPEAQGRGLGAELYRALLALLELMGVQMAYALVTIPNAASEHLHAAFGFNHMGVQRNAGFTCGAWHDVAWLTKPLGKFEDNPKPIMPFPVVIQQRPNAIQDILAHANAMLDEQAHVPQPHPQSHAS